MNIIKQRATFVLLLVLALVGCGQKGALYLEDGNSHEETQSMHLMEACRLV